MKAAGCLLSRKPGKKSSSVQMNWPQKKKNPQNINSVFNTHLSASLDSIAVQVLTAKGNHQVSIQQFVQHEFL